MIKQFALAAALFVSALPAFAQDVESSGTKGNSVKKPSRDFAMLQLTYDGWDKPDSVKTKGFNRGANVYICYDFPIKKSHFSFAAGIGIGTSNVYFDNQQIVNTIDTAAAATFIAETKNYKKYKLNLTYLEAPFELRFFGNNDNRNKGFKAAVGLRVGTLVGAHTKGKLSGLKVTDKTQTKRYLETWRFAATARIGWGNFSLFGSYNLSNVFKENQGPTITPYSFGICVTGL